MIPPLSRHQLADRIRVAARQTEGSGRFVTAASIAKGELPPAPEPLPPPSVKPVTETRRPGAPEFPLDEAAAMLTRARSKITVSDATPGILRPWYRNQGGFNFIVLEAAERLVEINRQLQRQNQALHERVMAAEKWMTEAAQSSRQQHDWMLAVENRLNGITSARLAALDERVAALESERPQPPEPGTAGPH